MGTSTEKSVWASGGAYEPYVGRWSRLVAREFVEWLAIPPAAWWLDVGCGTGALTETILVRSNPAQVDGIDPSEGYLAVAREQVRDPRVRFEAGDARRLSAASANYDAVVSALVLNFIDDYWTPFLGGQFPAPDYAMARDEAARAALREHIRTRLPIAADGSIALIARAWAVRGTR